MMINTIYGEMDDSVLQRVDQRAETDSEIVEAVEYWFHNELVHRSVHLTLKRNISANGEATAF